MRTIIFIFSLMTIGLMNAQTSIEVRAKDQSDRMKTSLNLTTEQYAQVYEINRGILIKNEDVKNGTFSEELKKEIFYSNQSARNEMLKGVLTPAQFAQFEKDEKPEIKSKSYEKAKDEEIKN
ncbi:MAG: hypothetical protein EBS09_09330 [Flavobacteriia bacterium]|nr:hypothetical protein [Flavobacteriia bacterium]NBV67648.1 hypothetical protein [Flavobacteriia bacterium]NBY39621.1 hypothetical protein [Flavobacteriia bacterium]